MFTFQRQHLLAMTDEFC